MKKIVSRAFISASIGLLLLQTACITRGGDFSSDISWVQKGKTTQSEVQKYLGSPTSVGSSGGTPTWTYGFYNYRLIGESSTKELKFYWENGKVQDYSFNSSFPEDRRRLISMPAVR